MYRKNFCRKCDIDQKQLKTFPTNFLYHNRNVDNPSRSIPDLGTVRREINEAINIWESVLPIKFHEVRSEAEADVKIKFAIGDHGDPYPFDGSGRILAHAFPPGSGIGGDIHLDDDERWTVSLTGDPYHYQVSLRSIVTHEFGHSMGLSHSHDEDSVMYAFYQYDLVPKLSYDDLLAVHTLYGVTIDHQRTSTTTEMPPILPEVPDKESSDRYDTTVHPDTNPWQPFLKPDPCNSEYDAVASIRHEIFVFKNEWFWRVHQDGTLSQSPHLITSLWKEAKWPVDAAVESNHQIFLFAGKDIYIFNGRKLVSKKKLTDLGLPASIQRIRLVYTWNYWSERPMYIWTKDEFWRVDKKSGKVEIGYPRKIATTWHGIPDQASAAVTYNDDLYFFGENNVYKFHTINMTSAPPISISELWRFCPLAMQISSGVNVNTSFDPQFTLFSLLLFIFIILD
ncbi:unnamed protein product [Thelazia callipaeda]|uniref:ZnMc domain-containing protein n=1 Tax=Thelazia callipaeda TaxID=103827 RepID=A0A0N5D347_THECL|nr:unnamed protein product [Thelazia callipaeda]